jgi:hypothetical protein
MPASPSGSPEPSPRASLRARAQTAAADGNDAEFGPSSLRSHEVGDMAAMAQAWLEAGGGSTDGVLDLSGGTTELAPPSPGSEGGALRPLNSPAGLVGAEEEKEDAAGHEDSGGDDDGGGGGGGFSGMKLEVSMEADWEAHAAGRETPQLTPHAQEEVDEVKQQIRRHLAAKKEAADRKQAAAEHAARLERRPDGEHAPAEAAGAQGEGKLAEASPVACTDGAVMMMMTSVSSRARTEKSEKSATPSHDTDIEAIKREADAAFDRESPRAAQLVSFDSHRAGGGGLGLGGVTAPWDGESSPGSPLPPGIDYQGGSPLPPGIRESAADPAEFDAGSETEEGGGRLGRHGARVALAFQLCATDEEDDGGDEDTAPALGLGRRGVSAPWASLPTARSEPTRTASEAQDAALAQQLEDAHQEISSLKAHIQELVMKGHQIQQEPPPPRQRQQLRLMPAVAAAGAAADPQEEEAMARRAASEALRVQGFSPRQIEEAEAGMRGNGLPFTPQTVRAISRMLLTLSEIRPANAEAGDDGLPPAITPSQTSVTDDARPPPVAAGSRGDRAHSPPPEPEQSEHHPEPPLDQGEHSPRASAETLGVILRRAHPSPEVRLSSLGKPAVDTAEADRGGRDDEEGKRQGGGVETVAAAAAAAAAEGYSAAQRAEIERSAQDALRAIADDGVSLDGNPGTGPDADANRDLSCPEGDTPATAAAPAAPAAVSPQLGGGTPQPRSAQGGAAVEDEAAIAAIRKLQGMGVGGGEPAAAAAAAATPARAASKLPRRSAEAAGRSQLPTRGAPQLVPAPRLRTLVHLPGEGHQPPAAGHTAQVEAAAERPEEEATEEISDFPRRMRVLARAVLRTGAALGSSKAGRVNAGDVIEVEAATTDAETGVVRVRCGAGWLSMGTRSGKPLLATVSQRTYQVLAPQAVRASAEPSSVKTGRVELGDVVVATEYVKVSGRFHIFCGRFDWDLPICCVFLS